MVANPYRCEERLLPPLGLALHGQTGGPTPRAQMAELSPDQVSRILPGVVLPEGAKAFAYQLARPRPNDGIIISYPEDGCEVQRNVLRLALRATPAKLIVAPPPELPVGITGPATVFLQAVLDLEGRLLEPVYIGGPRELEAAAREALEKWRAEPYRINGAPVAAGVVLQVRFGPS